MLEQLKKDCTTLMLKPITITPLNSINNCFTILFSVEETTTEIKALFDSYFEQKNLYFVSEVHDYDLAETIYDGKSYFNPKYKIKYMFE